jgi:hypothetical protein
VIIDRTSARDVTADDIRHLINAQAREENALEFKEEYRSASVLKAACAIANFGGGFIVVGIVEDDNHRACRLRTVANIERVEESARQVLRDSLSPRPVIEVVSLSVDGFDVLVIRVSPENPPHMVSSDKSTDFFNRYDATSDRMRYEEIAERFRAKYEASGFLSSYETPGVTIESTAGRTSVSLGTEGFYKNTIEELFHSGGAALAIVAASEGMTGEMDEESARHALEQPLYFRQGGWIVANPRAAVVSRAAGWEQPFPGNTTRITTSGDVVFIASVGGPLCREPEELYPYAVAEYCVSFAYLLADVIASSLPQKLIIVPVLGAQERRLRLPLGEPGSIWYDQQRTTANSMTGNRSGVPIVLPISIGRPVLSRIVAFKIASQIYEFFSYAPDKVAFAYNGQITVEPDAVTATLISVKAYLRDILLTLMEPWHFDALRRTFSMGFTLRGSRRVVWISELFLRTHHLEEPELFELLDSYDLAGKLKAARPDNNLMLGTAGVVPLPPNP